MKSLRIFLFLSVLPLFAFVNAHKFYISVTNVDYSSKDQAIQIITRVFVDDMDAVLKERYGCLLYTSDAADDLTRFVLGCLGFF